MSRLRDFFKNQMIDNAGVVPEHKWNERDGCFYLNSPAGLIRYKPKTVADIERFRNRYINRFEQISATCDGKHMIRRYFELYHDIFKNERVKYTANFHTRFRGKLCNLI